MCRGDASLTATRLAALTDGGYLTEVLRYHGVDEVAPVLDGRAVVPPIVHVSAAADLLEKGGASQSSSDNNAELRSTTELFCVRNETTRLAIGTTVRGLLSGVGRLRSHVGMERLLKCVRLIVLPWCTATGDLVLVDGTKPKLTKRVRVLGEEGTCGVVVRITTAVYDVQFYDVDSDTSFVVSFKAQALLPARSLFGHAFGGEVSTVYRMLTKSSDALGIAAARRCIVYMLLSWPQHIQLTRTVVCGSANLLLLSKLIIASECAGCVELSLLRLQKVVCSVWLHSCWCVVVGCCVCACFRLRLSMRVCRDGVCLERRRGTGRVCDRACVEHCVGRWVEVAADVFCVTGNRGTGPRCVHVAVRHLHADGTKGRCVFCEEADCLIQRGFPRRR